MDVAIRELTAFIWKTKKLGPFLVLRKFTPDEPRHSLARKLWKIDPSYFQHYYSAQRIGEKDGAGYEFGRGSAYACGADLCRIGNRLVLRPNLWRVERPAGATWCDDEGRFRDELSSAVAGFSRLGVQREPAGPVRTIHRGFGGKDVANRLKSPTRRQDSAGRSLPAAQKNYQVVLGARGHPRLVIRGWKS